MAGDVFTIMNRLDSNAKELDRLDEKLKDIEVQIDALRDEDRDSILALTDAGIHIRPGEHIVGDQVVVWRDFSSGQLQVGRAISYYDVEQRIAKAIEADGAEPEADSPDDYHNVPGYPLLTWDEARSEPYVLGECGVFIYPSYIARCINQSQTWEDIRRDNSVTDDEIRECLRYHADHNPPAEAEPANDRGDLSAYPTLAWIDGHKTPVVTVDWAGSPVVYCTDFVANKWIEHDWSADDLKAKYGISQQQADDCLSYFHAHHAESPVTIAVAAGSVS